MAVCVCGCVCVCGPVRQIERRATWDEEHDTWLLHRLNYAGNNILRSAAAQPTNAVRLPTTGRALACLTRNHALKRGRSVL